MKEILQKIHRNWIRPETRYKAIDIIYMIYAFLMLFHHIYTTAHYTTAPKQGVLFFVPWIIFAITSVILGRMWRDPGFWMLAAFLLIKFLRMIPDSIVFELNAYYLIMSMYAFFGCYCVGRVIWPDYRKVFLKAFCSLWVLASVILACLGLYVAWTGTTVFSNSVDLVYILDNRLNMFDHPVISGILMSISIAVAMLNCYLFRKVWVTILNIIAMVIMLIAGGLTATRASFIITAAEISYLICFHLYNKLQPQKRKKYYFLSVKKTLIVLGVFVLTFVSLTLVQMRIIDGFNLIHSKGALISVAKAEETVSSQPLIMTREFNTENGLNGFLTGRIKIWENVIQVIREDPMILLKGRAPNEPMTPVNVLRSSEGLFKVYHCHNMYFQTLLENGIPGLLLYLGFTLYFIKCACSLVLNQELPLWQRLVVLPSIGCILEGFVDITTHTNYGNPQMTAMFFFFGITAALSSSIKGKSQNNIQHQ